MSNYSEKLIKLRGDKSQTFVAASVGISTSALAMYECGKRVPRDEIKIALARFFGTTVGELFFDQECHETCPTQDDLH